jgi:hypothetical protein
MIAGAWFRDGVVSVEFQDGGRAEFAVADLRLDRPWVVHWSRLSFDRLAVVAPTDGEDLELTGFWIRSLTDPEFAAHLARVGAREDRFVGRQIRAWREAEGLTREALADRAEVSASVLGEIEDGHDRADLVALDRILAGLGRKLVDLHDAAAVERLAATGPA